jgi:hypothetical protein
VIRLKASFHIIMALHQPLPLRTCLLINITQVVVGTVLCTPHKRPNG